MDLSLSTSLYSFVKRVVLADVIQSVVDADLGYPFELRTAVVHPSHTSSIVLAATLVLTIGGVVHYSQVDKPIVERVVVDVVYLPCWHFLVAEQER